MPLGPDCPEREYPRSAVVSLRADWTSAEEATSEQWLAALRGSGRERDAAVASLHELLIRAARFELSRRREALHFVRGEELDDIANQAADDALVAILAKLGDFRGASRFTTWAYKFVLLEAGVKARRRAWQGREVSLDDTAWDRVRDSGPTAQQRVEDAEALRAIRDAVQTVLTPHQRTVFTALAIQEVPIDVL